MLKSSADNKKWYQRPVTYGILGVIIIGTYLLLPKSLFHSFNCDAKTNITRTNYQATNGFFIDNHVIVIGPLDAVNAVIGDPEMPGQVGTAGVLLNLVEGCDLSYLNTRKFEQAPSPNQTPQVTVPVPTQTLQVSQTVGSTSLSTIQTQEATNSLYTSPKLTADQRKSLVMRLYEIPQGNESTESVINQINRAGKGLVLADPDYIVSLLDGDSGICGQPYSGGGSPYSGGGSPYSGGGSTTAGPGISSTDVSSQFMYQWALNEHGINLPSSSKLTGRGVRVGVFDTSPFRDTYLLFPRRIQIAQPTPLWLAPRNAMGPDPISNHGLFVSGLIHAIAKNSTIKLIRVLNDNGCGNLWEIDLALQGFTSRESALTSKLNKVVINLSLGVHIPDADHANEAQDSLGSQHVDWDQIQGDLDKLHAFTLEETLINAHELGAVIVAAAGNDSAPKPGEVPLPAQAMQFPARYDKVIGVAATTSGGDRACYSNIGDVAAPGGDGGQIDVVQPDGTTKSYPCAARANTWDIGLNPCTTDMASCDFGIMSLLIVPDKSGRWKYDFGIWSGTSFSTPLVSGLAALSFEKIGSDSNLVECLIYNGATHAHLDEFEHGIINANQTLSMSLDSTQCPPQP